MATATLAPLPATPGGPQTAGDYVVANMTGPGNSNATVKLERTLDLHRTATAHHFLPDARSTANFDLLKAVGGDSQLVLTFDTVKCDYLPGAVGLHTIAPGPGLIHRLLFGGQPITEPIATAGTWQIADASGRVLALGSYNLAEYMQKLGASGAFSIGLPAFSLTQHHTSAEHDLPLCQLVAKLRVSNGKPTLIDADLLCYVLSRNSALHRQAVVQTTSRQLLDEYLQPPPSGDGPALLSKSPEELGKLVGARLSKLLSAGQSYEAAVSRGPQTWTSSRGSAAAPELQSTVHHQFFAATLLLEAVPERTLHSGAGTLEVLRKSAYPRLADSLEAIYKKAGFEVPTLAQLLLHTSGLPVQVDIGAGDLMAVLYDSRPAIDLATIMLTNVVPLHEPGAAYSFSFLGLAIAIAAARAAGREIDRADTATTSERIAQAYGKDTGLELAGKLTRKDLLNMARMTGLLGEGSEGWMAQLLYPKAPVVAGDSYVGYAGWTARRMSIKKQQRLVIYTGSSGKEGTLACVHVPEFKLFMTVSVAGALPHGASLALLAKKCASTMADMIAQPPAPMVMQMPAAGPAGGRLIQRVDSLLLSGTRFDGPHHTFQSVLGKRLHGLFDRARSVVFGFDKTHHTHPSSHFVEMASPSGTRKYLLSWDSIKQLPSFGMKQLQRAGAFVMLDPHTHTPSGTVMRMELAGKNSPSVPMWSIRGELYAAPEFVDALYSKTDPSSDKFRERQMANTLADREAISAAASRAAAAKIGATVVDYDSESDSDSDREYASKKKTKNKLDGTGSVKVTLTNSGGALNMVRNPRVEWGQHAGDDGRHLYWIDYTRTGRQLHKWLHNWHTGPNHLPAHANDTALWVRTGQ